MQKNNQIGVFISLEGQDGSGKSSVIEPLKRWLSEEGIDTVTTREPGGTDLAEQLRALVLNEAMDPVTECMLMFASRVEHVRKVIEPALNEGKLVICDRFTDSSFAYQGGGNGVDLRTLEKLESMVIDKNGNAISPDITIWFDLSSEEAQKRRMAAREPDKFERQKLDFFERVSSAYKMRMESSNGRIIRVDASLSKELVLENVLNILGNFVRKKYSENHKALVVK